MLLGINSASRMAPNQSKVADHFPLFTKLPPEIRTPFGKLLFLGDRCQLVFLRVPVMKYSALQQLRRYAASLELSHLGMDHLNQSNCAL